MAAIRPESYYWRGLRLEYGSNGKIMKILLCAAFLGVSLACFGALPMKESAAKAPAFAPATLLIAGSSTMAQMLEAIGKRFTTMNPAAAAGLELEITESVIMQDIDHNIATLQAIRAMGVATAIDDFGTGFSSLSYLAKLPVDALKIDRSFVVDMTESPQGLALVSTLINLAHSLKLKVVAEGVETEEQSNLLRLC